MPSPFPGMDPYLEATDFWTGFHNRLLMYVADELQPQLPDNYVATVDVRIYLERPEETNGHGGTRIPDLEVIRTGPSAGWALGGQIAQIPREGWMLSADFPEYREAFVEVRDLDAGEVVTSVELLSPTNKRHGEGRRLYQRKQAELAASNVNLVEIDLLRGGAHTALPRERDLLALPPFHYLASIFRANESQQCQVFTWSLRDPLPTIPVPLAPEDHEASVDLQALFERTYDQSRMRRLLPYQRALEPPLSGEDAVWAESLLRAAGVTGGDSA